MRPATTQPGSPPEPLPGSPGSATTAASVVVGLAADASCDTDPLGDAVVLGLPDRVAVAEDEAPGVWPSVGADVALPAVAEGDFVGPEVGDFVGALVGAFVGDFVGDVVGGCCSSRATGVTPGETLAPPPCHDQPT